MKNVPKPMRPARPGCNLYTVADVARILDVTERTVWKWTAEGRLPEPIKMGERWTRWRKEEIDGLLD